MTKTLARAPLLVPFLFVTACTTPSDPSAPLASAAVVAAEEGAIAKDAPLSKGRRKLDRLAAQKAEQEAEPAQSVRQEASIASEIAAIFQRGRASWYGPGFDGRRTASGERFQPQAMTAAHRSLPFGTRVRVTHVSTGRSVVVRINDRGPFTKGRVIDLARSAAQQIGMAGLATVALYAVN